MENLIESIPWNTEPESKVPNFSKIRTPNGYSRRLPDPLPSGIRDPRTLARPVPLRQKPATIFVPTMNSFTVRGITHNEIPPLPRFRTRPDSPSESTGNSAMPENALDRKPSPESQISPAKRRQSQTPELRETKPPARMAARPIHLCPEPGVSLRKKVIPLPNRDSMGAAVKPAEQKCTGCGYGNEPRANICGLCKQPLLTRMERSRNDFVNALGTRNKVCVSCGKSNEYSNIFCDVCGSEVVYEKEKTRKSARVSTRKKSGFAGAIVSNLASLSIGIATGLAIARTIGLSIP